MKFKNVMDMHVHTDNSFDASDAAIKLCERAYDNHLRAVSFTDHLEVDSFVPIEDFRTLTNAYFDAVKSRDVYIGSVIVAAGIEMGQPHYNMELSQKILGKYNYDLVLASVHNLRDREDFSQMDYSKLDIDSLLKEYFNEELEMASVANYDVLAHLTYPLRYIVGEYGINVDLSKYKDIIDGILRAVIDREKSLEINSSGLRQKIGKPMPDIDIIKRYRELGGQNITIGSDAHRTEDLGSGIEECMSMALNIGFSHICLYQNRESLRIPID
ncbi:MAG: histidinol-phosphatase HisJ family protein [Clostridia bacterium]|nr:histidinol-phosphatase HisJ family protein [Clostridia bacterium]